MTLKVKLFTALALGTVAISGLAPVVGHAEEVSTGQTQADFTIHKNTHALTLDQAPNMSFESLALTDILSEETETKLIASTRSRATQAEAVNNTLKITDTHPDDKKPYWTLKAAMSNFKTNKTQELSTSGISLGKLTGDGSDITPGTTIGLGTEEKVLSYDGTQENPANRTLKLGNDTKLHLLRNSHLDHDTTDATAEITWTLGTDISTTLK